MADIRIAWKSRLTGFTGHGQWWPESARQSFEREIVKSNHDHPDIEHWIETSAALSAAGQRHNEGGG